MSFCALAISGFIGLGIAAFPLTGSAETDPATVPQTACNALVAAMTDMTSTNAANLSLAQSIIAWQVELFATLDADTSQTVREAVRNMAETVEMFQPIDPEVATAGLDALRTICPANFQ